jgi:uncharacterized membrane protein (DUF106 family)
MISKVILVVVLLAICFAACCVLAKHGEEEKMMNEHEAMANLDKQVQLRELQDAVRKVQEEKDRSDGNSENESTL